MQQQQVGGTHYVSKSIQPWDAMEAWLTHEEFIGFLRGNVIRYMARYRDKGGIEDLKKASHYNDKLIAVLEQEKKNQAARNGELNTHLGDPENCVAFAYRDGTIGWGFGLPAFTALLAIGRRSMLHRLIQELADENPEFAGERAEGQMMSGAYIVPGSSPDDYEENAVAANALAARMFRLAQELTSKGGVSNG